MHPLIEEAKSIIASWSSDEPRDLALAVAALCRHTLDAGGLPTDSRDWQRLRSAFDVSKGQSIMQSVARWDDLVRYADVDVQSNQEAFVKLGIVTWLVKLTAKQFGMLQASDPIPDFGEWKQCLCQCLEKYILVEQNLTRRDR